MSSLRPFIALALLLSLSLVQTAIISIESASSPTWNPSDTQFENGPISDKDWTFDDFKKHFTRTYTSEQEETDGQASFKQNMKKLRGIKCSPCGVTSLFDKNKDQLNGLKGFLPGKGDSSKNNLKKRSLQTTNPVTPPSSFDWRKYNVITSPKDQRSCGTCWAFTATAFFESELIRRNQTNLVIDLSEQLLYECDNVSYGCDGGYPSTALQVALVTGLPRQFFYTYNYSSSYPGICNAYTSNFKLNGASNIIEYYSGSQRMTDDQIIQKLLIRPLMIAVYVDDWFYYKPTSTDRTMKCVQPSGVSFGAVLNHAVLLIGYTETEWIIKNSWGTGFGVNGYIYVSRNEFSNCGVGFYISTLDYPLPLPKF